MNALHRTLQKLVDEAVEKQKHKNIQRWIPHFHVMPPVGWLNDPNGLCEYEGTYYAFFQMSPFEVHGGLKFWGLCTSKDLVHWEYKGAPLQPDQPYDCHGVYSGSALVEDGVMYVYYTGNVKLQGTYDYINNGRESNTVLAISRDGKTFETKKLLAAKGAGMKTVIVPEKNRRDVEELSREITGGLELVYAQNMNDVISHAFVQ